MISINQEDKVYFIKHGLSKKPLDDIIQSLKTHPNGDVHRILLNLVKLFKKRTLQSQESDIKKPCLPVYKKTRQEANLQLIEDD